MNLWRYDIHERTFTQLTRYTDYDIHYPSQGPEDMVFEQGGRLFLYPFATGQVKEIKISLITDNLLLQPKTIAVNDYLQHLSLSPDGKRVAAEARGDLFSLPAENGFVEDLTRTPGIAERYPSWSPDGKTIAYWSDRSGEYELWTMAPGVPASAKKITDYGAGFRYTLFWSPDSKKLAFIDKAAKIRIVELASGITTEVDQGLYYFHGDLEGFTLSWSPDSRWLAYARDLENMHHAVFIFDTQNKQRKQVTGGYYNCTNPVFSPDGNDLFLFTQQNFQPSYSDQDNTFIYANSTQLAAMALTAQSPSLLLPLNDDASARVQEVPKTGKPVTIDFEGLEQRLEILPVTPGNLGYLSVTKDKVLYIRSPNTGAADGKAALKYYDIHKREEKTILEEADACQLSANGEKVLVSRSGSWAVLSPEENCKFEKPLRLAEMLLTTDPKQEWRQLFMDTWRLERDYFYDPGMHGGDWPAVRDKYLGMIGEAMTREDVDFVIGEMIGELSSSHAFHWGGDLEKIKTAQTGYLGISWEAAGSFYRIAKILHGAPWDATARPPLAGPGMPVKEGDYLLAVNGVPITTAGEPFAAFRSLAGKTVELTYNHSASWAGAQKVVVKTLEDEYRLRNLEWIEGMRKRVDEATGGQVGYIFVPGTGADGQNELMRQFSAQWNKKALIIDERFNDGGQIPDRFIEMLNRPPLAFLALRDGHPIPWPQAANYGPKVMLINGWSGSGGDAFPDFFKKEKLGPLIGTRTWGGLIGASTYPTLIDGGIITAPCFRVFNPDGTWFKEGHGVDPDMEVPEDLGAMAKGIDPQLERAIMETLKQLKANSFKIPPQPTYEQRNK